MPVTADQKQRGRMRTSECTNAALTTSNASPGLPLAFPKHSQSPSAQNPLFLKCLPFVPPITQCPPLPVRKAVLDILIVTMTGGHYQHLIGDIINGPRTLRAQKREVESNTTQNLSTQNDNSTPTSRNPSSS